MSNGPKASGRERIKYTLRGAVLLKKNFTTTTQN
jgi:hypothetical protein